MQQKKKIPKVVRYKWKNLVTESSPRRKHGDLREDGFVFWYYRKRGGRIYETWLSPEKFEANKKKISERHKRSAPRRVEANRLARIRHSKKAKIYKKEWRKRSSHLVVKSVQKRRAKKINQLPESSNSKIISVIFETAARMTKCLGILFCVDHWIPIAKTGAHHHGNLCILPEGINLRKWSKVGTQISDKLCEILYGIAPHMISK